MSEESEIFEMPGGRIDYSGAYTDFVLMHSTSRSRLYRAVRGGKYFMLKTAATADGMQEASLRREYELSLGMQHQHVATVLTYEPSLPVGPAIVMEYVDGTDLRRFLSTNPDAATRRRIFSQLLDAVAYIHRSGIIHNDLKPENILITRINNDVKIIDFGYSADAAHYLTRTLGGTRRYASPELLERADDIDSRSDVYSLGVIMADLFGGNYQRIRRRCMSDERSRRYRNAEYLQTAWSRRNWRRRAALAAVVVAAVSGVFVWTLGRTSDMRQAVDEASVRVESLASRLDSVAESERIATERRRATVDSVVGQCRSSVDAEFERSRRAISAEIYCDFAERHVAAFDASVRQITDAAYTALDVTSTAEVRRIVDPEIAEKRAALASLARALQPMIEENTSCEEEFLYYKSLLRGGKPFRRWRQ